MRGQLGYLREQGFEVAVASAPGEDLERVARDEGVAVFPVPLEREIRPLADLRALFALLSVLRSFRPHLMNAGTPKAGLLAGLAARWCRVPARLYTLRGLRLETVSGARHTILVAFERLASSCARHVVCVSESLRQRFITARLAPAEKTSTLGAGSSNGVDTSRFRPRNGAEPEVEALAMKLGLPGGAPVVGFVGRFTRDKGLPDLAEAFFGPVRDRFPEARLLLIGDFEVGDPVPEAFRRRLLADPRVIRPGFVDDTAPFYALMDVLAFPSYREGFPNAPLEAAASGVPVAGYAATGTVDAVLSGETGTLVPTGEPEALAQALVAYLADADLSRRHGRAARERAEREFRRERVWEAWHQLYCRLLAERKLPLPEARARGAAS